MVFCVCMCVFYNSDQLVVALDFVACVFSSEFVCPRVAVHCMEILFLK